MSLGLTSLGLVIGLHLRLCPNYNTLSSSQNTASSVVHQLLSGGPSGVPPGMRKPGSLLWHPCSLFCPSLSCCKILFLSPCFIISRQNNSGILMHSKKIFGESVMLRTIWTSVQIMTNAKFHLQLHYRQPLIMCDNLFIFSKSTLFLKQLQVHVQQRLSLTFPWCH